MIVIEGNNFYLISIIVDLRLVALYILEAFNLLFFGLMLVYFFLLSFSDPSDPRLKDPSYSEPGEKLRKCYGCNAQVLFDSHHCNACKRCVN